MREVERYRHARDRPAAAPPVAFVPRWGEGWRDLFPMYAELCDRDQVHNVSRGDYWVLSRFEGVFQAARDTAVFSSADGLTTTYGERELIGLAEAQPIVMMDAPEHTAFRRLVARGFTPRRVASLEPMVRRWVGERLDATRGEEQLDIVERLFKPLSSIVIAQPRSSRR